MNNDFELSVVVETLWASPHNEIEATLSAPKLNDLSIRSPRSIFKELRMRRTISIGWFAGLLLLGWPSCAPVALAEQKTYNEFEVKAAMLYRFTQFVTWPSNTFAERTSPLVLGVVGDDSLKKYLDVFNGAQSQGRKLIIRRFSADEAYDNCHIIYISDSEQRRVKEVLKPLATKPVLTVSDINGFAHQGGMMGMVSKGQKINFEINTNASAEAGLTMSSQLLRLGDNVETKK